MRGHRDRVGGKLTLPPPPPAAGRDGSPGSMPAGASVSTDSTGALRAPRDPPPRRRSAPPPPPTAGGRAAGVAPSRFQPHLVGLE